MIKTLIVEDQRMIREMMESYIRSTSGYEVAGTLAGAAKAPGFCTGNDVDLVLMDVCTENGESGFCAAERIKESHPSIKVIIVTSMLDA